ncbi:hypothetical protein I79_006841 [Cricetulus griseus]|uniref:Uncharacterized protein n=1 Tax=Cricetulus griseus TaxID=10029 RepID=G3H8Z2_CRIGR|nr:hypothetical protein I79_006841 [Cricetulus griseus]
MTLQDTASLLQGQCVPGSHHIMLGSPRRAVKTYCEDLTVKDLWRGVATSSWACGGYLPTSIFSRSSTLKRPFFF